jgi:hypothetical protein
VKHSSLGQGHADIHHLESVSNLSRMEHHLGCARQREQVLAAGLQKDEALLRDSEDRFDEMLLPRKPHNQSSSFETGQPPTERSRNFSEDFDR